MPVHNADIAHAFEDVADLLEIRGANAFRVRAYRNAARTVGELQLDLAAAVQRGEALPKLPGIGKDLESKIREIAGSGRCSLLEELRAGAPPAVGELLHVPGLGPNRVRALVEGLHVQSLDELRSAAQHGKLHALPGFGETIERNVLKALEARLSKERRFALATAVQYADALIEHLRFCRGVREVVAAGSLRRMRETVGDIDILATAQDASPVMARFVTYPEVDRVLSEGATRSSVLLECGLQVDLRAVAPESYGSALHYFTGSRAHNIAVRRLARERGLKLNEYGVFRGSRRIAGDTEESVFASVGLPFIPPELREDAGEIDAARTGRLPQLVELRQLRGDLHCHTNWSDGRHSVREMALAARSHGLAYLAVTDHSRRLAVAHGLDAARLRRQVEEVHALRVPGLALLTGIEVEILEDGTLDLPDGVLARLDIVVAAVHSGFGLPRPRQTERVLRALEHPCVTVLAHPSTRLIDRREPCELDMAAVVRKAAATGCFLELNAHPERLDLGDVHCRMAKEAGALLSVNSDAHGIQQFDNLRYGIGQARRGWLCADDVANTRPLAELKKLVRRPRTRVVPARGTARVTARAE